MGDRAVLVVGGTGYVAAYVIARLVKQGVRVHTTVRSAGQAWTVREQVAAAGAEPSGVGVVLDPLAADPRAVDPRAVDPSAAGWDTALHGCRAVVWAPDPPGLPERTAWGGGGALGAVLASPAARGLPVLAALPWWAELPAPAPGLTLIAYGDLLGPLLGPDLPPGLDLLGDLLEQRSIGVPRRWLGIVDVRDLAELVHRMLDRLAEQDWPDVIEVGSAPVALAEVGWLLRDELGEAAARVPWLSLPDPVVGVLARVRPRRWRPLLPELGHWHDVDARAAVDLLGHPLRPVDQTVLDAARSIVKLRPQRESGAVPAWTPMGRI